jgi:hypothetical protein
MVKSQNCQILGGGSKLVATQAASTGIGSAELSQQDDGSGVLQDNIAMPLTPQSLIDMGQTQIAQWGPVTATYTVPTASGSTTVTRLASPDPFTATYQMPDGEIIVSNEPLSSLLDPNYQSTDPPVLAWTEPNGNTIHHYQGEILVTFKPEVTQQQIEQFIALNNLHVKMSWFEPGSKPGCGNDMAWFQFDYNQNQFTTFGSAYTFFTASDLVWEVAPNTTDEIANSYGDANGNLVSWPTDYWGTGTFYGASAVEAFGVDASPLVRLGPEAGGSFSTQVVCVVDNGVYRNHCDFTTGLLSNPGPNNSLGIKGKISWIGVDTDDNHIYIGTKTKLRGEPAYYSSNGYLVSHGTEMAGIISSGTKNPIRGETIGFGAASLAPSALILPIRMKSTGDNTESLCSVMKACRALRFFFAHTQWVERVRVVNMSQGDQYDTYWWPYYSLKEQIALDQRRYDRVYVSGAGNAENTTNGRHVRRYPAAFDNVIGVTGALASYSATEPHWTFSAHSMSNYYSDLQTYDVSGIFGFGAGRSQYIPRTPAAYGVLPSRPAYGYDWFYSQAEGTSCATAQISSLAFLLYDAQARYTNNKDASSRQQVTNRIIDTRGPQMNVPSNPIGVMPGVARFSQALSQWGGN